MNDNLMKKTVASALLLFAATSASAGDFTDIPLTSPNATVVSGSNNLVADQLYLNSTVGAWLIDGVDDYTNQIAQSIAYTYAGGSATLTLLDYRETDDFLLGGEEAGDFFDMVYRDSRDNKLVFATRVEMEAEEELPKPGVEETELELNYLYRTGFTGYATSAAWSFTTDNDLRMYNAARTDSTSLDGPFLSNTDMVRMQADISVEEGNPFSGLYLIKTDATNYMLSSNGIGYFQAGEEGQTPTGEFIAGFAPVAAVPEPETYALMLAGLGFIAFASRRRMK